MPMGLWTSVGEVELDPLAVGALAERHAASQSVGLRRPTRRKTEYYLTQSINAGW